MTDHQKQAQENLRRSRTRLIDGSAHVIARLWQPAQLIAGKQANPDKDDNKPRVAPGSTPPISLKDTSLLDDTADLLALAATTIGLPLTQARHLAHNDTEALAGFVASGASVLASKPDGGRWADDMAAAATALKLMCRDTSPDERWRQALVPYEPSRIAAMLTDLTGERVTASRIRRARSDGRIVPVAGKVELGLVAGAVHLAPGVS